MFKNLKAPVRGERITIENGHLNDWLPEDTLTALRHYLFSIKGPRV